MQSPSTKEIIDKLGEKGENRNDLQNAMLDFLKDELQHLLEVRVEKEHVAFENRVARIHVKLYLAGEVISSDYVSVAD